MYGHDSPNIQRGRADGQARSVRTELGEQYVWHAWRFCRLEDRPQQDHAFHVGDRAGQNLAGVIDRDRLPELPAAGRVDPGVEVDGHGILVRPEHRPLHEDELARATDGREGTPHPDAMIVEAQGRRGAEADWVCQRLQAGLEGAPESAKLTLGGRVGAGELALIIEAEQIRPTP